MEIKTFILPNPSEKEKRHELVQEAITTYFGEGAKVVYSPKGKPSITGLAREKFISVTTTGNIMLCVCSQSPVGVDGEYLPRFADENNKTDYTALADRFFSEEEAEFVRNGEEDRTRFARIWVRKEAYVKLVGTGVSDFPNFSVNDGERFMSRVNGVPIRKFTINFPDSKDYLFAIAGVE